MQHKIPSSFWPLALLGFIVPSAAILQALAVAWHLSKSGAISTVLPILVAIGAATRIASGIPLGHCVRRQGADTCLFMALRIEVVILLGMAIIVYGVGSVWLLVPLEILSALAITSFLISRQTLLKFALAESDGRDAASGVSRALTYASKLIFPVVGGSLLLFMEAYLALVCCSVILALSTILLGSSVSTCKSSCEDREEKDDFIVGLRKTLSFFGNNPEALDAVILMALFNFVLSPLTVIIPMHVSRLPFSTSLDLGLSEASLGAGAVCGAIIFSRIRAGTPRYFAIMISCASFALFFSAKPEIKFAYHIFNISLFGIAMSVAYSGSLIDSIFIKLIPGSLYATIVGVQILLVGASYPLGLFVSSWFLRSENFVAIIASYNASLSLLVFAFLQISAKARCSANRNPKCGEGNGPERLPPR